MSGLLSTVRRLVKTNDLQKKGTSANIIDTNSVVLKREILACRWAVLVRRLNCKHQRNQDRNVYME